jgi:hypothetical protein
MKTLIASSLVVLGLTTATFAQDAAPMAPAETTTAPAVDAETGEPAPEFASLDTDGSGGISYEEAVVFWPDLNTNDFAAADISSDGEWSQEEFEAVLADPNLASS